LSDPRQYNPLSLKRHNAYASFKNSFNGLMGDSVLGGAVVDHLSFAHDDNIDRMQSYADFVQHAHHGGAHRTKALHLLKPVHLVRWVQIGQRFVHQIEVGRAANFVFMVRA